jgi:hypothetical protein
MNQRFSLQALAHSKNTTINKLIYWDNFQHLRVTKMNKIKETITLNLTSYSLN